MTPRDHPRWVTRFASWVTLSGGEEVENLVRFRPGGEFQRIAALIPPPQFPFGSKPGMRANWRHFLVEPSGFFVGNLAGSGVLATTFIALSCASLAGCAPQSNGALTIADPAPNAAALQTQPQPGVASGHASTSDYRIMSGDVLQITVFQVQDFNREAQVDAVGNIVLPLIGGVPAAGKMCMRSSPKSRTAASEIPSKPTGAGDDQGRRRPPCERPRSGREVLVSSRYAATQRLPRCSPKRRDSPIRRINHRF